MLSPWLRKQRIKTASPFIQGKVLDYGCGVGALLEICRPGYYLGIDIDEESLDIARKKYPALRFEKNFPMYDCFDTIVLLAVIEHIKNPEAFLRKIKHILMPNGRIVITTPHPLIGKLYSLGAKIDLFSMKASKEHEQLINHQNMHRIATQSGFVIHKYKRFLLGLNQLFILGHM